MVLIYKILIIYLYSFIIFFSSIGFGIFFKKYILQLKERINLFEGYLLSVPFLIFLGLLLNFFIPINYFVTVFVSLFGLILFILNKKFVILNYFKELIVLKVFLMPFFIGTNLHEDFYYHHLPYLNLISNYKIIFGLVNFNDVLANPYMSWFNYSSLFGLPPFKFELNYILNYLIFLSFLGFIYVNYKNSNNKEEKIISFIIITVSLVIFSKLKNFGVDIAPQIFILLGFLYLIKYNYKDEQINILLSVLYFSSSIIIRINSVFILPLLVYSIVKLYFKINLQKKIIFISFILIFGTSFLAKNVINTGCLIYPVNFTCISNLEWGISSEINSKRMNLLEASSKGYMFYSKEFNPTKNKFVWSEAANILSHKEFINKGPLFWSKYWLKDHDKNRLLNIFIVNTILLIFILICIRFKKKDASNLKSVSMLFFLIIISITFWYFKTPQSRFAGFSLFIVLGIFLSTKILNYFEYENFLKMKKTIIFSILFFLVINFIENFRNFQNNIKNFESNDLSTINKFTELDKDIDYIEKNINGIKINLRLPSLKLYAGNINEDINYILFCGDIKQLCTPILKVSCFTEIKRRWSYLFIYSDNNNCLKLLNRNIIY